jgi:hypothetical protein
MQFSKTAPVHTCADFSGLLGMERTGILYFYGQMKHCRKAKDRTEAKDEQEYFELRGVSTFNHQFRTYSCELGVTSMFLTLVQNTFYYCSTERAQ